MPLNNFLSGRNGCSIRRGDMVFLIADPGPRPGSWVPCLFAHTGIADQDLVNYELHDSISVLHMSGQIERNIWRMGALHRVDASGSMASIGDWDRDQIIDRALEYHSPPPSIFGAMSCCYWIGDCASAPFPLHPTRQNTYAFSCATFAHRCYEDVVGKVVDTEAIPFIRDDERRRLEVDLGRIGCRHLTSFIELRPFRRLYPSYLMHAFREDYYPFVCNDWEARKDHGVFIPPNAPNPPGDESPHRSDADNEDRA